MNNNHPDRSKLDPRAFEAILTGCALHPKAWEYYCAKTGKAGKSRNLIFNENFGSSMGKLAFERGIAAKEDSNYENFLITLVEKTPSPPEPVNPKDGENMDNFDLPHRNCGP